MQISRNSEIVHPVAETFIYQSGYIYYRLQQINWNHIKDLCADFFFFLRCRGCRCVCVCARFGMCKLYFPLARKLVSRALVNESLVFLFVLNSVISFRDFSFSLVFASRGLLCARSHTSHLDMYVSLCMCIWSMNVRQVQCCWNFSSIHILRV